MERVIKDYRIWMVIFVVLLALSAVYLVLQWPRGEQIPSHGVFVIGSEKVLKSRSFGFTASF